MAIQFKCKSLVIYTKNVRKICTMYVKTQMAFCWICRTPKRHLVITSTACHNPWKITPLNVESDCLLHHGLATMSTWKSPEFWAAVQLLRDAFTVQTHRACGFSPTSLLAHGGHSACREKHLTASEGKGKNNASFWRHRRSSVFSQTEQTRSVTKTETQKHFEQWEAPFFPSCSQCSSNFTKCLMQSRV